MCLNICSFACELLGMGALNHWFGTEEMLLAEWFMCVAVCFLWFSGHKNWVEWDSPSLALLSVLSLFLFPLMLCSACLSIPLIYYFLPSTLSIPVYWRNLKHAVWDYLTPLWPIWTNCRVISALATFSVVQQNKSTGRHMQFLLVCFSAN